MLYKQSFYTGSNQRKSSIDALIPTDNFSSIILFIHGYKGFKDWGAWKGLQHFFATHNFAFVKANLSHNGGTIEQPIDFPDLEAFSKNTYSKEVYDIKKAIEWVKSQPLLNGKKIYLLGHSRGGGGVLLAAQEQEDINGVITLASISSISNRFPTGEQLEHWLEEGIRIEINSRTKQQMPIRRDIYDDFMAHRDELDLSKACMTLNSKGTPVLHIHGDSDDAVSPDESRQLAEWSKGALVLVKGANHTFGAKHPWSGFKLPSELNFAAHEVLHFIQHNG